VTSDERGEASPLVPYVDDSLANVKLVQRILERQRPLLGFLATNDGKTGFELALEHLPALVLLDLNLPGMQGDEVLAKLRSQPETRGLPVVIMSGDATSDRIERLLGLGATEYLTKPFSMPHLIEVIDRYTG
jgi:CheY-like chemotaxis protein